MHRGMVISFDWKKTVKLYGPVYEPWTTVHGPCWIGAQILLQNELYNPNTITKFDERVKTHMTRTA